ncbi:MAG: S8 family serine peptidase [Pseudomonadota bacterium]
MRSLLTRSLRRSKANRYLPLVALISALVAVAATTASAQSIGIGRGMSMSPSMSVAPRINMGPSNLRLNDTSLMRERFRASKVINSKVKGKHPGRGTDVATYPTGDGKGRPPRDPKRPPRGPYGDGPRGPGFGPIIGTGVLIGTLGAAGATPVPPPPPPPGFSGGPQGPQGPGGGINIPPPDENRFVSNEVMLEFVGNLPATAINALAVRHRLQQIEAFTYSLTNTTWFRARITDGRDVRTVLRSLGREASLRSAQPNYLFTLSQAEPAPQIVPPANPETVIPVPTPAAAAAGAMPAQAGDPAQYMLTKMRVGEAHGLARGSNVIVAVIDSQIELNHPELKGVIVGSYDALNSPDQKPHMHGTGIAGSIAAHSRLMGVAPSARVLAIRAFSPTETNAEATSSAIIKGVEYAATNGARVINMSFAGPSDPALSRHLAAAYGRGVVLIAAAGNFGAKSPPQYPAADKNVIAVSATDENDKLFAASNRGNHIAVAAPGVDILMPAPDANYQVKSGTSFSAAHVAGIAALILERAPQLPPEAVRAIIVSSARDLGAPGKDPEFGAGLADAYQAILTLEARTAGSAPAIQPTASR